MSSAVLRRTSVRAAALSAVALLALTGCSDGTDQENTDQAETSASAEATASPSATEETTAEPVSFEAGDCLMADPGIRNVASFEKVDCEGEHRAEYLWAVPEADPEAEDAPDTEAACRAQTERYADEVEVTLTATELRHATDQSQHCIMYSVDDLWSGQTIDPSITLDEALAQQ